MVATIRRGCLFVLLLAVVARGQSMSMVPIGGEGNTIVVSPGDTIRIEIFVAGVAPTLMRGYQATLEPSATGGSSGTVEFLPNLVDPCGQGRSPCVDDHRNDYAFLGAAAFPVATAGPPPRIAAAAFAGSEVLIDEARYGGEFVYQASADANGTFTIKYRLAANATQISDPGQHVIPFTPIEATVIVVCPNDEACQDGLFCNGAESCVDGVCGPGEEPCVDPGAPLCDEANDRCVECLNDNACDDGEVCNGLERCINGFCQPGFEAGPGTPCGDGGQSPCNDPDTCDGNGVCLDNVFSDGESCNDGSFCSVGEVCMSAECVGGEPRDCADALDCTIDSCNDDLQICDHIIDDGSCLIEGICYDAGRTNPENKCEVCDPSLSATDWSSGDGDNCLILGTCFFEGEANPENECEACRPELSATNWSPVDEDSACSPDSNECTDDVCQAGVCMHPAAAQGTACDDGNSCTGTGAPGVGDDVCDGLGGCAGEPDPNCSDDCINAVEVFDGSNVGTNVGFGEDDAEASCQPESNQDAWFTYQAHCDGLVRLTTTGSVFAPSNDTVVSVLDGCGGGEIACDDDGGPGLLSALVFEATAGETYFVRVAGFMDSEGSIQLNLRPLSMCYIDGECILNGDPNPESPCEVCMTTFSTSDWTAAPKGTTCGDPSSSQCDSADACDGAGTCERNNKPDGSRCATDENECTVDVCLAGVCSHPPKEAGVACGDPFQSECDGSDTCDGKGSCQNNFATTGTACGDTTHTDCNDPDTCDGSGACLENLVDDGAACTDDANECTNDICAAGVCDHPNRPAGFACGDSMDSDCDHPDTCNGTGQCEMNLEENGSSCDDGEVCTGPDRCDAGACIGAFIPEAPIVETIGPRSIAVTPQPPGSAPSQALQLTSPEHPCLLKYVDVNGRLVDDPVFMSPDDWGTVLVADREIGPSTEFVLTALCGGAESMSSSATTYDWSDVNDDGLVDIDDLFCVLDGFVSVFVDCPAGALDLAPCRPDRLIDIFDFFAVLDTFQGDSYPCAGPCDNGACCVDGECVIESEGECGSAGGSYLGDGMDCAADPCPNDSRSNSRTDVSQGQGPAEGETRLRAIPRQGRVDPGGNIIVDVYVETVAPIRGYQLNLEVRGGGALLGPARLWVDETRRGFVYESAEHLTVSDQVNGRLAGIVLGSAKRQTPRSYLGSFEYEVPASMRSRILVRITDDTVLLDTEGHVIDANVDDTSVIVTSDERGKARRFR